MNENYFRKLSEYFCDLDINTVDSQDIHRIKRTLLDYLGCGIFAASNSCSQNVVDFIMTMDGKNDEATIWGKEEKCSPQVASFVNAARTSNIENDDCSSNGAGVHPGVYVFSAAIAAWEEENTDMDTFLKSVLFGYDVCIRMGLLVTESTRELGLHGPGLVGGLASVASAGIVKGLNVDQMSNAFQMTAAMLPLCPFSSFIEGADVKDFYGGWGTYVAMHCVKAAKMGLTGPVNILEGEKSLKSIFSGEKGKDVKPGEHLYIRNTAFKEFPACHATHPAMTVILSLLDEREIDTNKIDRVIVKSYPFSCDLNAGVTEPLNGSSARLSLKYTTAYALIEGKLEPDAFFDENLHSEKYKSLFDKIEVEKHLEYGTGPFGIRGTIIEIYMNDGEVIIRDTNAPRWGDDVTDEQLISKFKRLSSDGLSADRQQAMVDYIFSIEKQDNLEELIGMLRSVELAKK